MEIIYIALLVLFASLIGTMTGFGTSTIMVPVLSIFFPFSQTLLFVGIIHWFGNVWKITLFKRGLNWKIILGFGIPGIVASYIGASLSLQLPEEMIKGILGGFLLAYTVFLFLQSRFRLQRGIMNMIEGGTLSGFFAGIFGVGGAVRSVFLSAFDLPKAVYISTAGAIALFIDTTRLITYVKGGTQLEPLFFWGMIVFIPISLLGAKIAQKIVNRIPQKYFRLFIGVFLAIIGIYFLLALV
ncbi:MAG: sulfite exporter TauE/SafE family protein [Patescibacteria group bacterium]|nr:sulfite exporter TauE/SafE family protein [Patescibacteria group bacterium]